MEVKALLRQIRDLKLSLKLEEKDHMLTKKELENAKEALEHQTSEMNTDLQAKLGSLRNEYVIQIEQLRSQLGLSQIKARNLQIKYDELLAKSMDTQEERELRMMEYMDQQAQLNQQMVAMFHQEMTKLQAMKVN